MLPVAAISAAIAATGFRALVVVLLRGWPHAVELVVQLVARVGEVFEQLDFAVKVNQEGFVALDAGFRIGGEHEVDELAGGLALGVHGRRDAAAGVDQKAETERQIALRGKALDHLRAAVFGEGEVLGRQVGDQRALFVFDHDGQQYFARLHFDVGDGLLSGGLLRCAGAAHCEKREQRHRGERKSKVKS